MPARLPDFLGLGTQKGGTTSLHQWLNMHPQVYLPPCQEVHYFDLNYEKSRDWYQKHFEAAKNGQRCGEITPFYLFHQEVPARIKETLPEVKMIVLLRDPVERALSQIFHARERGFELLEPTAAIAAEEERLATGGMENLQKHSYINRSRYLEQLDRYEKIFPSEQLLIIKSEDLFTRSKDSWGRIRKFLGLEKEMATERMPYMNKGQERNTDETNKLRKELRNKLRTTALGIRKRYGFGWEWAE